MPNILDFLAHTHTPWSHARGRAGTALLLREIGAAPGSRVLEIGFGTGQTLVEIAVRWPNAQLFGLERSMLMLRAAQRRWQFCGLDNPLSLRLAEVDRLPYPDDFFDLVYAESVLGILTPTTILALLTEIGRVLKPGGRFLNNESLWREGVPLERQQEVNARCRALFGIPQAPEGVAGPEAWCALAEKTGLQRKGYLSMHGLAIPIQRQWNLALLRSRIFSAWGKLKARLSPALRKQRRGLHATEQEFSHWGPLLEGSLFHFSKPVVRP